MQTVYGLYCSPEPRAAGQSSYFICCEYYGLLQSLAGETVSLSVYPFCLVLHWTHGRCVATSSGVFGGEGGFLLAQAKKRTFEAGPEQELRIACFTWEEIKIKLSVITTAT